MADEKAFTYLATAGALMRDYAAKRLIEIRQEAAALEAFLGVTDRDDDEDDARETPSGSGAMTGLQDRVLAELAAANGAELRVVDLVERLQRTGWRFGTSHRATVAVTRALTGVKARQVQRRKEGAKRGSPVYYSMPPTAAAVTETTEQ